MFCVERREEFNEKGLEAHYLSQCPMLYQCQYCVQVRGWREEALVERRREEALVERRREEALGERRR